MTPEQMDAIIAVGEWLSASLGDPSVCVEMKRDVREFFDVVFDDELLAYWDKRDE